MVATYDSLRASIPSLFMREISVVRWIPRREVKQLMRLAVVELEVHSEPFATPHRAFTTSALA
jgi:hypothetical protein